jgi:ABC-2 type transport system permease protein
MIDRDVMTVIDVSWFSGMLDGVVPGVAVLVGLDLLLGGIAVYLLSRASSSAVK